MLIENVNGVRRASSMMKNSSFYIEVAKFVQAYTTIINNPNDFLTEINEQTIDEQKDKLTWEQFVKIAKTCDFGFKTAPTTDDLVVFYNYALEIGTIDPKDRKIASVNDVADAQKHYYNFVDEAKDRAEAEYLRQKRITERRESESAAIDNKISGIKAKNYICMVFMMIACFIGGLGAVSFLFDNVIANTLGGFAGEFARYVGGALLLILSILMFAVFDKIYIKTKREYLKLYQASEMIFKRADENYAIERNLKRKLTAVSKDLKVVEAELKDKNKKFDVKHNIEILKTTNKYYKRFADLEAEQTIGFSQEETQMSAGAEDEQNEFAPIILTKEQEENLREVSKEAIKLEGQFDVDAFNEKFEKSSKKKEEKEEEKTEEQIQEQQEEELMESVDFIKNVLGFKNEQNQNLEDLEKSK